MAHSAGRSSSSSSDSHDGASTIINNLDRNLLLSLVLDTRRQTVDVPVNLACTITDPPKRGSYNVVYKIDFSDNTSWAVRIPSTPWDTTRAHAMRLDMIGLQYLSENTSIPIPRLYAFSCTTDNAIQYPYMIMDYIHGIRLVDVWSEPSWWIGERSKERTLTSIARHMVELSKLQFDKIGCLDRSGPDGLYHIVPLPCPFLDDEDYHGPTTPIGPFPSTHAYLLSLLETRRKDRGPGLQGHYALLRLFIGALPDVRYDGPPFTLAPPDFDSQNVLVDESGEVAAFIDWDGLATQPQQLGALAYPAWLTVDWDPLMYSLYQEEPNCDTQADLHSYREIYTSAVDRFSGGTLGHVVRNSHVVSTLAVALFSTPMLSEIIAHLGKYMFGSNRLTFDAMDGIEHSAWFTTDHSREVAEVKEYDYFEREDDSEGEDEDEGGSDDHRSGHSRTEDESVP